MIGFRLATSLLTVWCPACTAGESNLDSRAEVRTPVSMQCPPDETPAQSPDDNPDSGQGAAPREIPRSTTSSPGQWACLACCTWLLTPVQTAEMFATTTAAAPSMVLITLSSVDREPLVPPPIRRHIL